MVPFALLRLHHHDRLFRISRRVLIRSADVFKTNLRPEARYLAWLCCSHRHWRYHGNLLSVVEKSAKGYGQADSEMGSVDLISSKKRHGRKLRSSVPFRLSKIQSAAFWYKERGYARWWLKKYDAAIADFTKAIALDPKDYASFAYRGELYSYRKNHKQAIDDLTKAIELSPKTGRYYYVRGVAYHWLEDVDKALADYDKAIELGYDLRRSHAGKASVHGAMKNFDKAINEYEAAAKSPRKDEGDETLDRLTRLYIAEAQFENAKKSAEQWVEESHSNRAYRALISICEATGDKESAMKARNQFVDKLSEGIAEHSSNGVYYEQRASIYKELGDKKNADSDYDRALELCKTLESTFFLIATGKN